MEIIKDTWNLVSGFIPMVAILGVFIEISPIKINPLSCILSWIGKRLNKDLNEKINSIEKEVQDISFKVDENEISRIRHEILSFANLCRQGLEHTKDDFLHIIEINEKYHKILDNRKLTNGVLDEEFLTIKKYYEKWQEKEMQD